MKRIRYQTSGPDARQRRRRAAIVATLVTVGLVVGGIALRSMHSHRPEVTPNCLAHAAGEVYQLDLEQAANAATISAVGKRMGLPDHAVTIALAAALQESRLRNLSHGDRDSLGLFQQRPSQGWGTANQVMTPRYASAAFYQRLTKIAGWQALAVTASAQQVQLSAAPDAYAQWEPEARVLAQALTGEVPSGLACRFPMNDPTLGSATTGQGSLPATMTRELGPPTIDVTVTPARGWTVASWLVGHAAEYRISSVAFGGQRWTPGRGAWVADTTAGATVAVTTATSGK